VLEHLAEQVRDQDAALAGGDEAPHVGEELAGRVDVQRRRRLVEHDQIERILGEREGACHLHHLPSADREVAHVGGCGDVVARKDLVELLVDQPRRAPPPAEAAQRRVVDARVLGDGEVRAERELLEDAADAELLRPRHRVVFLHRALDRDAAAVGRERAREHLHERRLARAVVADEAHALAGRDVEVDAFERADGAEVLFDAVQVDDERSDRKRHARDSRQAGIVRRAWAAAATSSGSP